MSQKLIQKRQSRQKLSTKKKLTFEQINPRWCHIIHREPSTKQTEFVQNHTKLDLTDNKFCVVGEAHGFKNGYFDYGSDDFCQQCFNHSLRFPYLLEVPPTERRDEVNAFVSHWNESHI